MVRCENCQHLLTRGHETGTGTCWIIPDQGKVYVAAERNCKEHKPEDVKQTKHFGRMK